MERECGMVVTCNAAGFSVFPLALALLAVMVTLVDDRDGRRLRAEETRDGVRLSRTFTHTHVYNKEHRS